MKGKTFRRDEMRRGDLKAAETAEKSRAEKVDLIFTTALTATIAAKLVTSNDPHCYCRRATHCTRAHRKPRETGGRSPASTSREPISLGKRLEILKEIVPKLPRFAFYDPRNPVASGPPNWRLRRSRGRGGSSLSTALRTVKGTSGGCARDQAANRCLLHVTRCNARLNWSSPKRVKRLRTDDPWIHGSVIEGGPASYGVNSS